MGETPKTALYRSVTGINRLGVRLQYLSEPDWIDFQLPPGHICILTDDGTSLTGELARTLTEKGWRVVVVSFLQFLSAEVSLPPEVKRVVIEEGDLAQLDAFAKLAEGIAAKYGSIAALIHLHPVLNNREEEHSMLERVFFLAKHLKPSLNKASKQGHSCFITVAHLDGELGTSGREYSPITGGLFGLTKALRWEWSSVFCRAIDLNRKLDTAVAVKHIIAELHDPNRLIAEVGYNSKGRNTLEVRT